MRHDAPDQEQETKWDSGSSTLINEGDAEAEERQRCWLSVMECADARKAAKAGRKAAKNQVLFDIITQGELVVIGRALHPDLEKQVSAVVNGQGLANNPTIDENIAFNANTFKWTKLRQSVHVKKMAKYNGNKQKSSTFQQDNEILSPILAQLGVSTGSLKANRQRKSLDAKLRVAILGDLVAFENDQVETMQRMAAYWRYANKRVYNEMVRNNELWDWATGEKLPEITELDITGEEDETPESGTKSAEAERQVPENRTDLGFELPFGNAAPSPSLSIDSSDTNRKASRSDAFSEQTSEVSATKLDDDIQVNLTSLTMGIKALPPTSSDENWEGLQTKTGAQREENTKNLDGSPAPKILLSPAIEGLHHGTGFQGIKDTRVLGTAINEAPLPLQKNPPRRSSQSNQTLFSLSVTQKRDLPDHENRFGTLNREVPAPCEEVGRKLDDGAISTKSVIRIPAKPIVKTLAIHDDIDDWETMRRAKGTKKVKGSAAVVGPGKPAAVTVKKFSRGKSFAAAVKRGP